MQVLSFLRKEPNPALSLQALRGFNELLSSPDDAKLQDPLRFKKAVEHAQALLKDLTDSDRQRAVTDVIGRWAPKGDVVAYEPLARLNYLVWKLDPSPGARAEIIPLVEDLYLKYLRQGAFVGMISCHPELTSLSKLLSPQFVFGEQAYEAARSGLSLRLRKGEFSDDIFRYIGFDSFREKLLQDEGMRSAAREGLNVLAARGQLNYEGAFRQAKLFGVTSHLTSAQFIENVKSGIRDLVTNNPGRWLGRLRDGSKSLADQVSLFNLNEMALFLPWGDVRKNSIPSATREFVAEVRPMVRERVLEVIGNDVRSLFGGNSAEDLALTVELFLGNGFYSQKETQKALANATVNRLSNFRDAQPLREYSTPELWELLSRLPPEVAKQLRERPLLNKAARKLVGRLMDDMQRQVELFGNYAREKFDGEQLASQYAYPIIAISRAFGLDEPLLPQVPSRCETDYQKRRTALLIKKDPCLLNEVAATMEALQNAAGPLDFSLVSPIERLAEKRTALNKDTSNWPLTRLAEGIRYFHSPSGVARRSDLARMSEAEIRASLAFVYRSSELWQKLNCVVDRRILIDMANALDAQAV